AYFAVYRGVNSPPGDEIENFLQCGERLQRLWLTATQMGLVLQPALAPLCFAWHAQADTALSRDPRIVKLAAKAGECFADGPSVLFLARIGTPKKNPRATRSLRRALANLMQATAQNEIVPELSPRNVSS